MNGDITNTPLSPIKQAYLKLQEMQSRLDAAEEARREPIAIVGMACRFPGANNDPESFWQFLREGGDAIREVPHDRWDINAFYDPNPGTPGKMYTRSGGFLDRVDLFEPQFFGIAPREATRIDPQQRLLLEVVWEALEHSGIAPDGLSGSRTGVFVGVCTNDYSDLQVRGLEVTTLDAYHASGIAHSMASGRLSYVLGLQGPSMTLDTACSSSLVAVHLGCQSLRRRECKLALAGGVNVILTPDMFIALSKASMLARDGRCKTFDASADGYARGEGCGVVVLKRLSDALADGDRILALIRGSAVNQDGPSSGLTAPNGPAQTSVIREALADGGIAPQQVSYVETHGTGTSLGDPIEVQALAAAYCGGRGRSNPLPIGALKSNIGHLEGAAGVAGLIKVVLALQNREIPASLHLKTPNPFIAWDELSVKVITELTPWEASGGPLIAGLSSFGFSGTNAHVIVEQAPLREAVRPAAERPRHLLTLSARSEQALHALFARYAEYLESQAGDEIGDLCYTANAGRAHQPYRVAILAESAPDLRAKLATLAAGGASAAGIFIGHKEAAEPPKPVFLFTGQGAQFPGMGLELYKTHPGFRSTLDRCREILRDELHPDLLSVLYPAPGEASPVNETAFTQPALFSLEYALAQLWLSWGIVPSFVMGHSVGEYVAACIAGVFSLEDGLKLIAARGRLMQQKCERGLMAAVAAPQERVASELEGYTREVSIAALNGPANTVIAGRGEAVEELLAKFSNAGVKSKRLAVSHAFHSPLMEPMLEDFRSVARKVKFNAPQISLVSNLSGRVASAQKLADPDYWVRHVREAVNFSASMQALQESGCRTFIELGPSPTLLGMGAKCMPEGFGAWLPSLRKERSDWQQMLESLAALYARGADVDWKSFDRDYGRHPVALPTYPFERSRCWIDVPGGEGRKKVMAVPRKTLNHPLLNDRIDSPFIENTVIEARLATATLPWLKDHQPFGATVLPATAYLEMVLAAAKEVLGPGSFVIREMDIREAMILEEEIVRSAQIVIGRQGENQASFQIASIAAGEEGSAAKWKIHAAGRIDVAVEEENRKDRESLEEIRSRCPREISVESYRQQFLDLGMYLGPSFKGLQRLWSGTDEVLAEVSLVPSIAPEAPLYRIHPALLDPCLQPFAAVSLSAADIASGNAIYMPVAIGSYTVYREPGAKSWSHVVVSHRGGPASTPASLEVDVSIFDATGVLVAEVRGLALRRVERHTLMKRREEPVRDWLYEMSWKEVPLIEETSTAFSALPAPSEISEDLLGYAGCYSRNAGLEEFASLFPQLEALSTQYVRHALGQLGWNIQGRARFTTEQKAAELKIPEKYRRLFARMLEMLEEGGILERRNQVWEVRVTAALDGSNLSGEQLLTKYPECSAELNMTIRCGEHLASVIRGEREPLELLFPGGSVEGIEKLYCDSPFARFYNGMAGTAVKALMKRLPGDRPLRVLEIGAGTGSTTGSVLPELQAGRVEYVFTDASPLFLSKAKAKFGDYPFVEYKLLDIEKDPDAQGFAAHSYDLVIAANVLHATEDLRTTVANVGKLLRSAGVLLLIEGTRPLRFGDLIVGLTDGWWRFNDTELRPSHALIPARSWQALLECCGFTDITVSPEARGVFANQALILSRGPRLPVTESESLLAAGQSSRPWLIFGDRGGLGEQLRDRLAAQGARCVSVSAGDAFEAIGEGRFRIRAGSTGDLCRVIQETARAHGSALAGIVYLWPLDLRAGAVVGCEDINARIQSGCDSLLHLVKAWAGAGTVQANGLWIVTRGAQALGSFAIPGELAQAPISALGATIALEHPELPCSRIDLDPDGEIDELTKLCAELQRGEENLVAFRGAHRFAGRLVRAQLDPEAQTQHAGAREYHLHTSSPGILDRLAWEPLQRRKPQAGEVEVEVLATGLNFRDVLIAMGQYPGDSQTFGYECAGDVISLGQGVHHLKLGQRVMVLGPGSFASHMTVPADHVIPVPESLSENEAASIPSAFLTAYYALCYLGRMGTGDRVLIHAAAGGVGLAAVQLAQRAGAEIFATAGSPRKREYLKSLGIQHVMDSRSLDFAAEIMRATAGKGVDIVLNSLAGDFIGKSFSVLAENGRFLEIGMTGIWDAARAAQLKRNVCYHPINLGATFREDPQLIARLMAELMKDFEKGRLKPMPLTVFPIDQIAGAFRHMAQAKHIGKIVVTHAAASRDRRQAAAPVITQTFDPAAGYLITGGLAGLGLLAGQWMVRNGARYVVLTGRSEPSREALEAIRLMEHHGAKVVVSVGDVSDRNHVAKLIEEFRGTRPRLAGLIHSAGALDDGILLHQNRERFQKVFAAKIAGSWNLHELTKDLALDFFVMFSSAVSLLGSAGQANHVAACAFEDALAHYRRAHGLPALSIDWGPWAEAGAATRGTVTRRVELRGFEPMQPEQAFRALERLLERAPARIGVMSVDWSQYAASVSRDSVPAFLSELNPKTEAAAPGVQQKKEPAAAFIDRLHAAPAAKRQNLLSEYVREQAMKVLGLDAAQPIGYNQPLSDLGLDSLMAVELRSLLSAGLALERSLPATLVFDYPTIAALTGYLAEEVWPSEKMPQPEVDAPHGDGLAGILDRIESLSEEEVDRLYNQEKAIFMISESRTL